MNIARRIAALKREIRYRETEIERIAALRSAKEPTITSSAVTAVPSALVVPRFSVSIYEFPVK